MLLSTPSRSKLCQLCKRTILQQLPSSAAFTTASYRPSQAATASEAATRLLETFSDRVSVSRQLIDANQLQKLSLTLGRPLLGDVDITRDAPPEGTPVPPGYHLVYFTPNGLESELGPDGTDRTFNAPAPFSRRMWAGGKMVWQDAGNEAASSTSLSSLRVGDQAEERTKLLSATAKKSKSAGEMVLVEVEKEIWSPRGLAVVDKRSWIFRPEVDPSAADQVPAPLKSSREPTTIRDVNQGDDNFPSRQMCWSPVGLFRFSALTFNGHKIHYNEDWTASVEGHAGLVVHGPLNLINTLDYWADVHSKGRGPKQVTYRAMAPVYAGDKYHIQTDGVNTTKDGTTVDVVVDKNGIVCMKAEIS